MDFIISVPLRRIIFTRQANPRLASVAAKVRRMRMRMVSVGLVGERERVRRRMMERMTASKARRAMRRCLRWEMRAMTVVRLMVGKRNEVIE